MDWDRYKRVCDQPNVFSRWMLEQTRDLIAREYAVPEHAHPLDAALASTPLPKPAGHRGGAEVDMFVLGLSLPQVAGVLDDVRAAAAAGVTTSGTRDRGLGGFVEAWAEYARFLERG